jgi:hypothetical protein
MVQLSKRKIKPEAMNKMFNLLFDVLGKQGNKNSFNIIIDGLFSPVEKIMIAKRVAIFFLIIKGEEWKTIRDIVKVSLASVSKCQMILRNNSEMQNTLNTLVNKKNLGIFIEELVLMIFGPGTAYINWKNAWRRKKELERKKAEIL